MEDIALHLKVGAEPIKVQPKNGRDFSLEELKEFIGGGYVEAVWLHGEYEGFVLFVDEEGILKNLPCNDIASDLNDTFIAGDCLLCPSYASSCANTHPFRGGMIAGCQS